MKFVINTGINPNQQLTELALMKLAVAIRSTVGFSKKVVFKAMKEMRNGALWVGYTVNGVKCSTFVKASNFAKLLSLASIQLNQVKADYCQSLKAKFPQISIIVDAGVINLSVPNNGKFTTYYISEDYNNNWELYTRKGQATPRKRFTSLPSMISALLKTPIS